MIQQKTFTNFCFSISTKYSLYTYFRVSLLPSGNLLLETVEGKIIEIGGEQFCIDGILDEGFNNVNIEEEGYDQFAIVCFEKELNEIDVFEVRLFKV